jgi:L-fucose isomerase-like protein
MIMNGEQQAVLGVIVGNRNFFPDSLITQGRQDILDVLREQNIDAVILDEQATKLGAVETWESAQKCAALFDENRHRIDGILITLPNFGDEKGVAETIKLSSLHVPILVQAYPDDLGKFGLERRRDAFCGKISVAIICINTAFLLASQNSIRSLLKPSLSEQIFNDLSRSVAW